MTLAVLTPSYAPDADLFRALHRSVLEFSADDVVHHVIVPHDDLPLFEPLRSRRLDLLSYRDVLPRNFVSTEWFARAVAHVPHLPRGIRFTALNRRRPWPPLRGWIVQQIVKLAVAQRLDADVAVLADSDVVFVRELRESLFRRDGAVRLYARPDGIAAEMVRHVRWHDTARRLIGAPSDGPPPYDDYIAGLISWDPAVVRACTARVDQAAGRAWQTVIGARLEFSEDVLYGEYLREHGTVAQRAFTTTTTPCHVHWGPEPLGSEDVDGFVSGMSPDAIAVQIQSNTTTSSQVRAAVRAAARRA